MPLVDDGGGSGGGSGGGGGDGLVLPPLPTATTLPRTGGDALLLLVGCPALDEDVCVGDGVRHALRANTFGLVVAGVSELEVSS